jgi:hypothetical protein
MDTDKTRIFDRELIEKIFRTSRAPGKLKLELEQGGFLTTDERINTDFFWGA